MRNLARLLFMARTHGPDSVQEDSRITNKENSFVQNHSNKEVDVMCLMDLLTAWIVGSFEQVSGVAHTSTFRALKSTYTVYRFSVRSYPGHKGKWGSQLLATSQIDTVHVIGRLQALPVSISENDSHKDLWSFNSCKSADCAKTVGLFFHPQRLRILIPW